ncbi:toxin-activating lysine-acyltransferase [Lonepinella sp. MS14435]|uniref:toxin-activating lysine-acyltransferase n=1 Tax=unclassified Lonepinella TaxID=2642006 RepID=UPI0036DBF167
MKIDTFDVIAPSIFTTESIDESQLFGAFATIWLCSEYHSKAPLYRFAERILPVLRNKQFALFIKDNAPVAYFSWAKFTKEAEEAYLRNDDVLLESTNWCSGDNLWIIDWFAPSNLTREIKPLIEQYLFPNEIWTALYHKSPVNHVQKRYFKGCAVSREQFRDFIRNHN